MNFSNEAKADIFRQSEYKTGKELAIHLRIEKRMKPQAYHNLLYQIRMQVANSPEDYGVTTEEAVRISKAVKSRSATGLVEKPTNGVLTESGFKDLVITNRNKIGSVISYKLDRLLKSRSKMDESKWNELTNLFNALFDKSQLLQGQSTENISIHAKIDDNMTPHDAIEAALKMREVNIEKSQKK